MLLKKKKKNTNDEEDPSHSHDHNLTIIFPFCLGYTTINIIFMYFPFILELIFCLHIYLYINIPIIH